MADKPDAAYVCAMEEVLDIYHGPYDPARPQVCLDELPYQLLSHGRPPLPPAPGRPAREDYQYGREGVANLFLAFEPLLGRTEIKVTRRRTKVDWAWMIKDLVDVHYPGAQKIVLVVDNLNTHVKASLYLAFAPAEAKRLADRIEIHYTPKHGSWLNMAEIMLSVLARQCLNRRLESLERLVGEVEAWLRSYRRRPLKVDWRFTTADARIKLKRLYPAIQHG